MSNALKCMDIEAVAQAIEADMGEPLADIRQALHEAKSGATGRVTTPAQMLARQARVQTGLSQAGFARMINTPVATLRDWEQGRFTPPGGVVCLLRLIVQHPELTNELQASV